MKKEIKQIQPNVDDNDQVEHFDTMLDENYYPNGIDIAGCTFYASDILLKLDPIAYRTIFFDYMDSEISEEKLPTWICPICGEIHQNKDEAEECCESENDDDDDE
jgi:hypothetical protein